jgi:ABC-type uncharacterized transport system substrate-binding protein
MQIDRTGRRDFLALLGSAAAAWPLRARAQAPIWPTIGFLSTGYKPDMPTSGFRLADDRSSHAVAFAAFIAAFRDGMSELGYAEGRNVSIAYRWAEGRFDRLDMLANELVRLQPKLIVASGGVVSAKAAMRATASTPILFVSGFDPVELGLVTSLNRPGGNATGASVFSTELLPKRLELLYGLGSRIQNVAVLLNPQSGSTEIEAKEAIAAAQLKGYQLRLFNASTALEIDAAFALATEQQVSALLITGSPFFSSQSRQIVELAARHAIPAMYPWREYVEVGGLMSYGAELTWGYQLVGRYAGRILKGDRPSDLPVQQPTRFKLVVNSKTAQALGLEIPSRLLTLVDEEI